MYRHIYTSIIGFLFLIDETWSVEYEYEFKYSYVNLSIIVIIKNIFDYNYNLTIMNNLSLSIR